MNVKDNLENNLEISNDDSKEIQAAFEDSFAEIDKIIEPREDQIKAPPSNQELQEKKSSNLIPENLLEEESNSEDEDNIELGELQPKNEIDSKTKVPFWKKNKRHYLAREALKNENLILHHEIENLKAMLSDSLNSGMYHASASAKSELERAKERQKIALDNADRDSFIEANVEISKAINKLNELEKWSYNNPPAPNNYSNQVQYSEQSNNNYQNQDNNYYRPSIEEEVVYDWIETHPYLQVNSSQYDSVLEKKVANYITKIDSYLQQTGQQNLKYSDEYFDNIDEYISKTKNAPAKIAQNIESVSQVGRVRNAYSSSPGKSTKSRSMQVTLNADEKMLAENMNIPEEVWLKKKIANLNLQK